MHINKKLHTSSRFVRLRAVSKLSTFVIHPVYDLHNIREGHPEGEFVRPTYFSQFGDADFENACYTGVQGAFGYNLKLKPRQST